MDIILFRHGPAGTRDAERWPDDTQRPLSPRGEQRTLRAARGLARLAPQARTIFSSPLTRAAQTAQTLKSVLDGASVSTLDALRPGGSPRDLLAALAKVPVATDAVVLVGHEPDLGQFGGTLVFGDTASLALKKAGACSIRFDGAITPGTGDLVWLLPPRVLRRLADKEGRA